MVGLFLRFWIIKQCWSDWHANISINWSWHTPPGNHLGISGIFGKLVFKFPPHFRPGFPSQKVVQMLHQFSVIKFLHLRITKRWSFLMLLCPTDCSLFREALCFQLICHQSYMYHVMSVFSCEYGHTLSQACLLPPRGRNSCPRARKRIENWKKVVRFSKVSSGRTYSGDFGY